MPPPSYIDITSYPFSTTVAQADFNAGTYGGVANEVWFRRVVSASEEYIGMFATQGGTFVPATRLFASDGVTLVRNAGTGKAWWFRITTGTYYIRIQNSPAGASNFDFTVTADVPPTLSVDFGDYIINDDTTIPGSSTVSFAATVWSNTGTFKGMLHPFPAGEIGDALPAGQSLWHDRFGTVGAAGTLALYDGSLNLVAGGISVGAMAGTFPNICNDGTKFFVVNRNTLGVYTVDTTGAVTGPIDTLGGGANYPYAVGVNRAGTILYHAHGYTNGNIGHWDLVGHAELGTLYTVPGFAAGDYVGLTALNNHPGEIIGLDDDTYVFTYHDDNLLTDHLIQIDSSGTLVQDHSFTAPNSIDHIHYSDAGNPSYVRMWLYTDNNAGNEGRTLDLLLSSGGQTVLYDGDLYSAGIDLVTNSNQKHRPSASCSIATLGYSTPVPPTTPPALPPSLPADCCDTTKSSGGGAIGSTCLPDDRQIPIWIPACSGGGYTVSASDITNSEDWSPP